ncbi:MAG: NupC/NupG family nucleoside CNT transporter, partial [Candidatus Cloacimonetes bacterium]|nr:NupC/NupG family nucleoside CNT transporter [Candidatus Cloacimonadota bacterium]
MYRLISFIGLFVLMGIAFILSTSRKHINWRTITMGVVLQFIIGIFVIKTGIGKALFSDVASIVNKIIAFTDKGASFVFGSLTDIKSMGLIFATDVLPPIIFISALMSILYFLGVMQKIVKWTAWIMIKLMGTSGSETLSAAANIFVGP